MSRPTLRSPALAPAPAPAPPRVRPAQHRAPDDAPPPDLRRAPTHAALDTTFANLIELYFAEHPCSHMGGAFKKWLDLFQFGEMSAWDMTAERLAAGADYLRNHKVLRGAKGYAVSTINRELSQLGTIYIWAIKTKRAPVGFVSPTLGEAGRKDERARYVEPFKPGEAQRMRSLARSFRDPKFTLFVWLFMDTSARRGELSDRCWTDFDLDDPHGPSVTLRAPDTEQDGDTKTGVARRLYFSPETAALLRRLRPAGEKYRNQLIFKSARGVAPNEYRKPWARLCKLLGRPGLHLHDVRHLVAADLLKAGKGVSQVSSLLGNSSLVLHRRYGHLDDKALRDIQAERLGLDTAPKEFEPVRSARDRHAAALADPHTHPMAEAKRLALLAHDAAAAAAAASVALAAAQEAMRVAMGEAPVPVARGLVQRVR